MAMYDLDYSDVQVWEGIFSHEPSYELWRRFQREYPDRAEEICEVNRPAWFWKTGLDRREPRSVDYVIDKLRIAGENDANYLLNAAPNRDGLLDEIVAQRFREVGQALREQDLLKE
jgi:alpha-L-fucosidase